MAQLKSREWDQAFELGSRPGKGICLRVAAQLPRGVGCRGERHRARPQRDKGWCPALSYWFSSHPFPRKGTKDPCPSGLRTGKVKKQAGTGIGAHGRCNSGGGWRGMVQWLNGLIFHLQMPVSHIGTSSCRSCSISQSPF